MLHVDERDLTVPEFAAKLGIHRVTAWAMARDGYVSTYKVKHLTLVHHGEVDRILHGTPLEPRGCKTG